MTCHEFRLEEDLTCSFSSILMVEGRHTIIKVKDQLMTVVELHDGRSAVLPYPGDMVESCRKFAIGERHTNYK